MLRYALASALLAAAALGYGPADAASVKYFTRAALPFAKVTYTATVSKGACSNGQIASTITACTSSTGQVVDNSKCGPAPTPVSCSASCTPLVNNEYDPGNGFGENNILTESAADASCAKLASELGAGTCNWDSQQHVTTLRPGSTALISIGVPQWWGTICK